ncbi:Aste57867_21534 [Aphanomyces stellatus]|uniref:Nickel/cobalt efflux system n=1 Tax=Aphanomyces stellatus TaxID=120398 RepID=A0A485LHR0_9STRA|nr:hypothetical protein As57867_021465 [Aphanomyces stellatus]VFT98204.1 Aste57867_21534 [Aphanomyces stellatus]
MWLSQTQGQIMSVKSLAQQDVTALSSVLDDKPPPVKRTAMPRITEGTVRSAKVTVAMLVLVNITMWATTLAAGITYPVILSPALVAYTLGLRHAVDADHIAAIDNVTRSLLQRGQQPVTVGLFFSLGHSSVVILMSLLVVCSANFVHDHVDAGKVVGGVVGTCVSASFLFLIGLVNAVSFARLHATWSRARQAHVGTPDSAINMDAIYGGVFTACCPSLVGVVDTPWKMYPLGFLFGLGFDTASEVALLAISAMASQSGVPSLLVLVLPAMFTCGMSLVDTLDGILMLWAYGWAYVHPAKKLFYNMFLTGLSAFVALFVGLVESLGLVSSQLHWHGRFADVIGAINDNFEMMGYCIIALFVTSFGVSYAVYEKYFAITMEGSQATETATLLDDRGLSRAI